MSPARSLCLCLVTILVAVACSEESTTSVAVLDIEAPTDLTFTFPNLTAESLVQGQAAEVIPSPGPAESLSMGESTEESTSPDEPPAAQIFGAGTNVGFTATCAYSNGRHRYDGNRGRVETTARLSYNGTQIGSQPAFQEDYTPFLLDFGQIKGIVAEAYIFTDRDCGLLVDGNSNHYSSWQWFLGGPAPSWGPAGRSTQAFPPVSQPDCEEEEPDSYTSGGGGGGGSEGSGSMTCWYSVHYDLSTGEIYDIDFLYCDEVGG